MLVISYDISLKDTGKIIDFLYKTYLELEPNLTQINWGLVILVTNLIII